jgi:uncharacterized protein with HEPN domain
MQHDVEKYLLDILNAARDFQQFVGSLDFDAYHANKLIKAAVERKFEIIGEALGRVASLSPETANSIHEYQKMIAFRNIIIHGYDQVSDPLVWDVIENKLPLLIEDIQHLLPS